MQGDAWPCRAMHGYVWPWMAIDVHFGLYGRIVIWGHEPIESGRFAIDWYRRRLLGHPVALALAVFVLCRAIVIWRHEAVEHSICYRLVPSASSGTPCGSSYGRFCVLW